MFRAVIDTKLKASSGSLTGLWLYGWTEQRTDPNTGLDEEPVGARTGTVTNSTTYLGPALEANNYEVAVGTVVFLRERGYIGDDMALEFDAPTAPEASPLKPAAPEEDSVPTFTSSGDLQNTPQYIEQGTDTVRQYTVPEVGDDPATSPVRALTVENAGGTPSVTEQTFTNGTGGGNGLTETLTPTTYITGTTLDSATAYSGALKVGGVLNYVIGNSGLTQGKFDAPTISGGNVTQFQTAFKVWNGASISTATETVTYSGGTVKTFDYQKIGFTAGTTFDFTNTTQTGLPSAVSLLLPVAVPVGVDSLASYTAAGAGVALTVGTGLAVAGAALTSTCQPADATLTALATFNTNGLLTQTAADTFAGRTITGTADKVTVTNGDGVSGNPTLTIAATYVGQSSITTVGTLTGGATGAGFTVALSASTVTGTLAAARLPAFGSGDVSFASGGGAGTIATSAVTLAKQADLAYARLIGRKTGSTGVPESVTVSEILNAGIGTSGGGFVYSNGTDWTLATGAGLGGIPYQSSSTAVTNLPGNTTTTKKFLRQTGNGSVSAAPVWDTVIAGDIASGTVALARGGTNADLSATGPGVLRQTSAGANVTVGQALDYVLLRDEKASATEGGTSTTGTNTRVLNTEVFDVSGLCSLASNQFTLSAGTYRIHAVVPAYRCGRTQAYLYNATAAAAVPDCESGSAYFENANNVNGFLHIKGKFTVAAGQALEIRQAVATGVATQGLGLYGNSGLTEIYTQVELWKEVG